MIESTNSAATDGEHHIFFIILQLKLRIMFNCQNILFATHDILLLYYIIYEIILILFLTYFEFIVSS